MPQNSKEIMDREISEPGVVAAVKELASRKSPGVNGPGTVFYKTLVCGACSDTERCLRRCTRETSPVTVTAAGVSFNTKEENKGS